MWNRGYFKVILIVFRNLNRDLLNLISIHQVISQLGKKELRKKILRIMSKKWAKYKEWFFFINENSFTNGFKMDQIIFFKILFLPQYVNSLNNGTEIQ